MTTKTTVLYYDTYLLPVWQVSSISGLLIRPLPAMLWLASASWAMMFLSGLVWMSMVKNPAKAMAGISPQAYKWWYGSYRDLWQLLDISYDKFIRTTYDYHERLWLTSWMSLAQDDIYLGGNIQVGILVSDEEFYWKPAGWSFPWRSWERVGLHHLDMKWRGFRRVLLPPPQQVPGPFVEFFKSHPTSLYRRPFQKCWNLISSRAWKIWVSRTTFA